MSVRSKIILFIAISFLVTAFMPLNSFARRLKIKCPKDTTLNAIESIDLKIKANDHFDGTNVKFSVIEGPGEFWEDRYIYYPEFNDIGDNQITIEAYEIENPDNRDQCSFNICVKNPTAFFYDDNPDSLATGWGTELTNNLHI